MIRYLIEKEFKQLLRNSFLPKLILFFPCMVMLLLPWAANLEVKNISLNIVDNDHSVLSRRLTDKIAASTYFRTTGLPDTYEQALRAVEKGEADVILEIPPDFEKQWTKGGSPSLLFVVNAVNGTKGILGNTYLTSIVSGYVGELQAEEGRTLQMGSPMPSLQVNTLNLYNSNLDYKLFMVPAMMVMLLTLLCGFLLVDRHPCAQYLFPAGLAALRHSPCRKLSYHLRLLVGLSALGVRFGAGHLQLFLHDAAGHVRHVVLHVDSAPHERSLHSHQQYAALGTMDNLFQSSSLLCGGDAYGLFAWWRSYGATPSVGRPFGFRLQFQPLGCTELSEK